MPEDTYRKSWNRQNKGLLIFLLDQSGSMQEPVQIQNKTYTNGQMATATLNNLIDSLIKNTSSDGKGPEDYCDLFVLGYGDEVTTLLPYKEPVSICELAKHPRGRIPVLVPDFDRKLRKTIQKREMRPYWIEYRADSRHTEMVKALQRAYQVVQNWLEADARRSQSFPPIILNITDDMHTGEGNPVEIARLIRELATNDGPALLYNCHLISTKQPRLTFPKQEQQIDAIRDEAEREWAKQLFEMSSPIPPRIWRKALKFVRDLEEDARGLLYNANPSDLACFLRWAIQPE